MSQSRRRVRAAARISGRGRLARAAIETLENRRLLSAGDIEWAAELGSTIVQRDEATAAAADGSVYVLGGTYGIMPGQSSAGWVDVFLRKYDAAGVELWTRQVGTDAADTPAGVAIDALGRVYVSGTVQGTLPGQTSAGEDDVFVRQYLPDGAEGWTRQFGTAGIDRCGGVGVDSAGRVYVVGSTYSALPGFTSAGYLDAFVRQYSAEGVEGWTDQFGSTSHDVAVGVVGDAAGNVYVGGHTYGELPGQSGVGGQDVFLKRYGPDGSAGWTRQFGTNTRDDAAGLAIDSAGHLYVAGSTFGVLPGQASAGQHDAAVWQYETDGDAGWARQFGSAEIDLGGAVAVDASGNVYVAGYVGENAALPDQTSAGWHDAFVRKLEPDGDQAWTRQFGSEYGDFAEGVAVTTNGTVCVVGRTAAALPGQTSAGNQDAFVRAYDASGVELWTRQFGTLGVSSSWDRGAALAVDGDVYVVGQVAGFLPGCTSAGDSDAFIARYSTDGDLLWVRQFGSAGRDTAYGVATDGAGHIYVVGSVRGALPGQTGLGIDDAFIRQYHADGSEGWTRQFGSASTDSARAVAVDAAGNIYVAGEVWGALPGQDHVGRTDAFVRQYLPDGTEGWVRQFGTAQDDQAVAVALDAAAGCLYVAGDVGGVLPGQASAGASDMFVRRYGLDGAEGWLRQFGSESSDMLLGLAVGAMGHVYVGGRVDAALPGQVLTGTLDAFVRQYTADGALGWTSQFGVAGEYSYAVAHSLVADASGGVYVAGDVSGVLPGQTSAGSADLFVRLYRLDGIESWTRQFGTTSADQMPRIARGGDGALYVTGQTGGRFTPGVPSWSDDVMVLKLDPRQGGVRREGGVLFFDGTEIADIVTSEGGVLRINGQTIDLLGITEVRVWGGEGADQIDLSGLAIPCFVDGGGGSDRITGGSADDVLLGGAGDDTVVASAGDDLLVGGEGSDVLTGSAGNDVLVAGTLAGTLADWRALVAEWVTSHATTPAEAEAADELVSDSSRDVLTGSAGYDWFLVSVGDRVTDARSRSSPWDTITYVS